MCKMKDEAMFRVGELPEMPLTVSTANGAWTDVGASASGIGSGTVQGSLVIGNVTISPTGLTVEGQAVTDAGEIYAALMAAMAGVPVGMSKDRITSIATTMAAKVGKNASVAPQLCFPHIYLGLTDLFASAPASAPAAAPSPQAPHKDWRKMLTELGGWDNELLSVPAGAVREIIEEVEALRAAGAPSKAAYRSCCDHPDCPTCGGHGGFYRLAAAPQLVDAAQAVPEGREPFAWGHDDFGTVELSRVQRAGWFPLYRTPPPAAQPAAQGAVPVIIGSITTGDLEGDEIGDWDVQFDHKVIDAMPEFARPETTYAIYLNAAPVAQPTDTTKGA